MCVLHAFSLYMLAYPRSHHVALHSVKEKLVPSSPPSYDKVMTAIRQELKFLHMQSASQRELNKLACKDLPDGLAVMDFFVQGCSLGTQSERSLPKRRKQIE